MMTMMMMMTTTVVKPWMSFYFRPRLFSRLHYALLRTSEEDLAMAHWGSCSGVCPHCYAGRAHWPAVSSSKEKAALWRTAATPHGKGGLPQRVVPEPFIKGLDTRAGPKTQTSRWLKHCSSPQGTSYQKSLIFVCEDHYLNCNLIQSVPFFYLRTHSWWPCWFLFILLTISLKPHIFKGKKMLFGH